jgi:hypothetical protein
MDVRERDRKKTPGCGLRMEEKKKETLVHPLLTSYDWYRCLLEQFSRMAAVAFRQATRVADGRGGSGVVAGDGGGAPSAAAPPSPPPLSDSSPGRRRARSARGATARS